MRQLKNQPLRTPLEVNVDLPWPAYLPRDYVPGQKLRDRGLSPAGARPRRLERLDDFRQELRDRFGPLPEPAEWLLRLAELRLLAARWQIAAIHRDGKDMVLSYRSKRLIAETGGSHGFNLAAGRRKKPPLAAGDARRAGAV